MKFRVDVIPKNGLVCLAAKFEDAVLNSRNSTYGHEDLILLRKTIGIW